MRRRAYRGERRIDRSVPDYPRWRFRLNLAYSPDTLYAAAQIYRLPDCTHHIQYERGLDHHNVGTPSDVKCHFPERFPGGGRSCCYVLRLPLSEDGRPRAKGHRTPTRTSRVGQDRHFGGSRCFHASRIAPTSVHMPLVRPDCAGCRMQHCHLGVDLEGSSCRPHPKSEHAAVSLRELVEATST